MTKLIRIIFTLVICSTCIFSFPLHASTPANPSLAPMLEKVLPAIVNIRAQIKITDISMLNKLQRQPNADGTIPDKILSVGSGVIVDANKGYILTNAHVVNDAETITITLGDGHHYTAKLIGADKPSDIALIQIQAKNLKAITFGNSNSLKVGDYVTAIGNPFGLGQSVTSGIVSALGRNTLGIENFENFIQIDASINPGNSGGALVNTNGELIGINTAILAPARGSIGIGFAIPSNMAKSVMEQLIQYGDVKRGMLGVGAQDITPDLATAFNIGDTKGAAVTQVVPNTPAEKAGLKVGDVITSINNAEIKSANDVVNAIGLIRVNSRASISILRNNKPITLTVLLYDPKKRIEQSEAIDPFLFGVALKDFTLLSPIHGNVTGVLVASVDQASNAWQADLQPGDVITSANQQRVTSIVELKKIADSAKDSLLLNVLRGPGAIFLIINK